MSEQRDALSNNLHGCQTLSWSPGGTVCESTAISNLSLRTRAHVVAPALLSEDDRAHFALSIFRPWRREGEDAL